MTIQWGLTPSPHGMVQAVDGCGDVKVEEAFFPHLLTFHFEIISYL